MTDETTTTNPYGPVDTTLDEWTRRVIETHFDPDTGTPFWLDWQDAQGIDVRAHITGFADLTDVFEPFDEDILRTLPVEQFAPRSLDGNRRVYETGGTTGAPKRIIMRDYWRQQACWTARVLDHWGFPTGNILGIAPPGGANNAGTFIQHLAHEWDRLPFHITMDPRWAKRLSNRPSPTELDEYVDHLLEQAERVLSTQSIDVLFTTARLLERPAVRDVVADSGIDGIIHGGTALDRDTYRVFREDWYTDQTLVGEYGNTLMGVAPEVPPAISAPAGREYHLDYVPCYPQFVPEIVDEDSALVDYGEQGTVRLTVLNEEFFLPLFEERDVATRIRGTDPFPWDWIRTPETDRDECCNTVEGVY